MMSPQPDRRGSGRLLWHSDAHALTLTRHRLASLACHVWMRGRSPSGRRPAISGSHSAGNTLRRIDSCRGEGHHAGGGNEDGRSRVSQSCVRPRHLPVCAHRLAASAPARFTRPPATGRGPPPPACAGGLGGGPRLHLARRDRATVVASARARLTRCPRPGTPQRRGKP